MATGGRQGEPSRRSGSSAPPSGERGIWFFDGAKFDEGAQKLEIDGKESEIAPQQRELLTKLLHARGDVVPEESYQRIRRLRDALNPYDTFILLVRGKGYRFDFDSGRVRFVSIGQPMEAPRLKSQEAVLQAPAYTLAERPLSRSPGMEVWPARDASGQERVFKFAVDNSCLRDLQREVTLLRLLQAALPGRRDLVQILDWNLSSPTYFLATEPAGQTLADWALGIGLKTLPQALILKLFIRIAQAVQAAHSIGVLHLDLTPRNILVAPTQDPGEWPVCLIDFGSGQLLDPAMLAVHEIDAVGLALQEVSPKPSSGMPFYVAPEVRRGEPAMARSDVYVLGVLFYQLLAGSLDRWLETGWEEEITDPLLCEDIREATQRDPARRIGSVAELIKRLQTLDARRTERRMLMALAQEKAALREEARRLEAVRRELAFQEEIGGRDRTLKEVTQTLRSERQTQRRRTRRERTVLLLVGLCALLLAYQTFTLNAALVAEHARGESADRFVAGVLTRADPLAPAGSEQAQADSPLEQAEADIDARLAGNKEERAKQLLTLSQDYFRRGDYGRTQALVEKAIPLLEQARGAEDARTVMARYLLVRTYDVRGQHARASALLDATDGQAGSLRTTPSLVTLLGLSVKASTLQAQDNPYEAQRWFEEAEAVRQQVTPKDPRWMLRILSSLAWCYVRTEHSQDAVQILERLVDESYFREKLELTDWSRLRIQLGLALRNVHRYAQAEQILADVVHTSLEAASEGSSITGWSLHELAGTYQAEGRWRMASSTDQHAYAVMRNMGMDGRETMEVQASLDVVEYLGSRNAARALPRLRRSRDELTKALGAKEPATQLASYYFANALCEEGQADEAARVAAGLDPKALAAADASESWKERLHALQGLLAIARGQVAEGRQGMDAAIGTLRQQGAPHWLLKRLAQQRDQASAAAQHHRRGMRPASSVVAPTRISHT